LISKLHGNLVEHMRSLLDLKGELWKYFHFDSEIWKRIRQHIGYDDECYLIDREGTILSHRGTGKSVRFLEAHIGQKNYSKGFPKEVKESEVFVIKFEVGYIDMYESEYDREYYLTIPFDLELNFSEEKFMEWAKKLAKDNKIEEKREDEIHQLRQLMAKYPEVERDY